MRVQLITRINELLSLRNTIQRFEDKPITVSITNQLWMDFIFSQFVYPHAVSLHYIYPNSFIRVIGVPPLRFVVLSIS